MNSFLSLTSLVPYQMHKDIIVNHNMRVIEAFLQGGVISAQQESPPPTPQEGDKYIIPSRHGWPEGQAHQIALYVSTKWLYITPSLGCIQWLNEANALYVFKGEWCQV